MKRLKSMAVFFERITTGVLFVTAIYIPVFYGWDEVIYVKILWQILFLSGICTLGSVIMPLDGEKEVSRLSMLVRHCLYYIYINAVVLVLGYVFGWFSFHHLEQVIGMVAAIAFVYFVIVLVCYWIQYREAEKMNRKLKERN
ncbi:MAG: DUF3021 domain-containing protein [Lachnospiraceae bacterium]|nr:DUF3021 domain-containing protein [Lachnospiraceae bacterium]